MNIEENKEETEKVGRQKRWQKVGLILLATLGITILVGWNIKISANLEDIKSQQIELLSQISVQHNFTNNDVEDYTQQIQDLLKAQDSLLADYSVTETARDLKAGTVQYKISSTPKTYQQGMTVSFAVNDGIHSVDIKGKESNHVFAATATCALTDKISISALLHQNGKIQIQVLEKFEGLLSETYLWADEDFGSFLVGSDPKNLPTSDSTYKAFINFNNDDISYDGTSRLDEIKTLDYYVLVNKKIVVSKVGKPGTQTFYGEEEETNQGYKVDVPMGFAKTLKAGDQIVIAVLITDESGRRYCADSAGLLVKTTNNNLIMKKDNQFKADPTFGVNFK